MSEQPKKKGIWPVIQSTIAGLFGIQSEKNRQEDFTKGSAMNFIVSGVIGLIVLLIGMNLLVNAVIAN